MGCKGSKSAGVNAPFVAEAQPAQPATAPQKKGELPPGTEVLFVLGGPGSGKGTQCDRIVAKYGLKHLSAGDLLRDEVKSKSALGLELESIMKEGKLVPQETTIALLRKAMIGSGCQRFLVDGFPRALDQAKTFERTVCLPRLVLFFDCPLETMEERLLSRGKTSGRSDDNAETIKKRFKTFQEQSIPVVDYYEERGKVKKISAVPPPEEVFLEVQQVLEGLQAQQAGEAAGAAQAIAAENQTQAVGAMQVDAAPDTVPSTRTTDSGKRTTDSGKRTTDSGKQTTDTGKRTTDSDKRTTESGKRITESGAAALPADDATATTTATAASPAAEGTEGIREVKQRPSFVGIEDEVLAAKIEEASQAPTKMSADGSRSVVEMPADASSAALPAAA
ncbi:hypothetical protein WJX84_010464 [Apatococcus fuscideae]|uniref:UMP-CMP kinase n=1 Tax=Apatococcus fuscideae TaxID=2026836 RepID=A0AAW1SVC3_9CHLO